MKAQFKYAFKSGLGIRGLVFAFVFVMNVIFIALGSIYQLPFAAHVTFLALSGTAVAVMLAADIAGDVIMIRRTFASQDAYLTALTPVPRWKTLLANVITMMIMDMLTMAFVIVSIVWLSFNFIGNDIGQIIRQAAFSNSLYLFYMIWLLLALITGYILFIMIVLFCAAMKKSVLFKLPASGLLTFLLTCGCFYAVNLLQLFLIPFSDVQVFGLMIILSPVSLAVYPVLFILTLLEIAVLFIITSKLIERKINI